MSQAPRIRTTPTRSLPAIVLLALLALLWPTPVHAAGAQPAASAAIATAAAPPADSAADSTVTWSVKPADTAQGRDRPNFAYDLAPGGTAGDALLVINRSAQPIELGVYAADGFLTPDGSLDILAGGETSTELGSWIAVGTDRVTLDSGQSAEIPFTLTIPADAPPGDYAAGVVASMIVTADNGTVTERRLGSRVHLRVQGELAPALAVSDVSVSYSGSLNPFDAGTATVTYTLTNTGNARLKPDVALTASGPFGLAALRAGDDAPELLPGSVIERTVEVAGVPPLVMLFADVATTSEVISRVPDAAFAPVLASASGATAAVPWTVLALLIVTAALIVWRVRAARKRAAAQKQAIADAVAAATAEQTGPTTADADDAAPGAASDAASDADAPQPARSS
ncbi:DUF916 domain-containing protein [Microbacterium sp. NPDC091313]